MADRSRTARSALESTGFLPVLKRWWFLIVIATAVAGLVGYFISASAAPEYESRVRMLIGPIAPAVDVQRASGLNAQTYAELATSTSVLETTIAELGLPMSVETLKQSVSATANSDTRILTIAVNADDPTLAPRIATSIADNLRELTQKSGTGAEGGLEVFDPAAEGYRLGAQSALIVAFAALAGMLGVLTLLLLTEFLRSTVRNEDDLLEIAPASYLGFVNRRPDAKSSGRLVFDGENGDSQLASRYQLLATQIEFFDRRSTPTTILVIGADRSSGSGEVGVNLAGAFASSGRKVIFVDANAVDAEATKIVGLDGQTGLTDILAGPTGEDGVVYYRSRTSDLLDVVPAGISGREAIDADRARQLLTELLAEHDLVVIAAAPPQESPSALTWSRVADASVLVVAADRTRRNRVADAVESLELVGAKIVGTILTRNAPMTSLFHKEGRATASRSWRAAPREATPEGSRNGSRKSDRGRAPGPAPVVSEPGSGTDD